LGATVEIVSLDPLFGSQRGIDTFYTFWKTGLDNLTKGATEEDLKKLEVAQ